MLNHRWSSAVLLRTEDDGTLIYRKNGKILRVTRAPSPGFYPPGGRREMYKDKTDPRTTRWFAEAVRERRAQGFNAGVKPGPQQL